MNYYHGRETDCRCGLDSGGFFSAAGGSSVGGGTAKTLNARFMGQKLNEIRIRLLFATRNFSFF